MAIILLLPLSRASEGVVGAPPWFSSARIDAEGLEHIAWPVAESSTLYTYLSLKTCNSFIPEVTIVIGVCMASGRRSRTIDARPHFLVDVALLVIPRDLLSALMIL